MELFYQELKKGKRKSEALRIAKLTFLEEADEITSDPFYWSSYYILGDDSPIAFSDEKRKVGWVLLIVLVLLVITSTVILKNRKGLHQIH